MFGRFCTILSVVLLLAAPLVLMRNVANSDFSQDYLAARAALTGQEPSAPTAALAAAYGVPRDAVTALQIAHPPPAILVALPFAALEWPIARLAFFAVSWAVVVRVYLCGGLRPGAQLAMLAPMIMGLHFGALEPLLFGLLAIVVGRQDGSPSITALALGGAIALKVYPVVLLYWLWRNGQRRAALHAIAVAGGIGLLTVGALGPGAWLDWLRFSAVNAGHFIGLTSNLSLTGFLHLLTGLSPTLLSVGLLICLSLPLYRAGKGIESMLPVMLLASPITWPHYVPAGLLGGVPQALLAATGLAVATSVAAVYRLLPLGAQPAISLFTTLSLMALWLHSLWAGYQAGRPAGEIPDLQAASVTAR